ncbi:hypothetical protein [Lysobacter gummosus]
MLLKARCIRLLDRGVSGFYELKRRGRLPQERRPPIVPTLTASTPQSR